VIALLTDFGLHDWYVGVMKAVVLAINPEACVIDLVHTVPRHDIEAAAFALLASYPYVPPGSIIVVVVDPGVGGEREILCASVAGRMFIAPDNGVLSPLLDKEGCEKLVRVANREIFLKPVSSTFHGRDIFAPVAAHLSLGVDIENLGPEVEEFERMEAAPPEVEGDRLVTRVRWVDGFGNLITGCPGSLVGEFTREGGQMVVDLGVRGLAPIAESYESVGEGEVLGIVGSSGYLEISVREASAAGMLGLTIGDAVTLRLRRS
jgi:hypothetical protein